MHKRFFLLFFLLFSVVTFFITYKPKPVIKGIIFDCDGILVDSEYKKYLSWKRALKDEKKTFSFEDYYPLVGHSGEYISKNLVRTKGYSDWQKLRERRKKFLDVLLQKDAIPISPAINFLEQLISNKKRSNFKLALASSASREEIFIVLRHLNIENAFDYVISGKDDLDEYGNVDNNKPKPYIYEKTAKALHLEPQECVVFEDTQAGIESAYYAHMIPIAVPNSFTMNQDFSLAQKLYFSFNELSTQDLLDNRKARKIFLNQKTIPKK